MAKASTAGPKMRHPKRLAEVTRLVGEIVDALDRMENVAKPLDRLRTLTGQHDLVEDDLRELYSHSSDEDMARRLLMPIQIPTGLDRDGLIEVMRQIDKNITNDAKLDYWVNVWCANEPSGLGSDLIFYPSDEWKAREGKTTGNFRPTPEEIVDEAYRVAAEKARARAEQPETKT